MDGWMDGKLIGLLHHFHIGSNNEDSSQTSGSSLDGSHAFNILLECVCRPLPSVDENIQVERVSCPESFIFFFNLSMGSFDRDRKTNGPCFEPV